MEGPLAPLDHPPVHLHAPTEFSPCQSVHRHHRIVRRHDGASDRVIPCRNVKCHFERSPGPTQWHTCPAHEEAKAEHPPSHSLILALPLSLVHLSLSTLSHTQARREEGKEEKGEGIEAWMQQEMAMETT